MIEIDEQFYKYPKMLMGADGYISRDTGEFIKLTDAEKNVYLVMKARNEYFEQHYDKQSDIAEMCNLTIKKAGDSIRDFIDHKIIEAEKGHSGTHKNWRYKKVHCLTLAKQTGSELVGDKKVFNFEIIGVLSESIWKKVEKKVTPKVAQPVPHWLEDDQGPF